MLLATTDRTAIRRRTGRNSLLLSLLAAIPLLADGGTAAADGPFTGPRVATNVAAVDLAREPIGSIPPPEFDPSVVILNSRAFSIPVRISDSGEPPVEVQLFVLGAQDKQWRLVDRQSPNVREFQFVGHADGPLWFTIRSVDSAGRVDPDGPLHPEVKVLVDTTQPEIVFDQDADADGSVEGVLRVTDATPIKNVRINYATDVRPTWQPLDQSIVADNGRFRFVPREDWRQLSMQVVVTDSAGNQSIEKSLMTRPRLAVQPGNRLAATAPGRPPALAAGFRNSAAPFVGETHSQANSRQGQDQGSPDESPRHSSVASPSPPERLAFNAPDGTTFREPYRPPYGIGPPDAARAAADMNRDPSGGFDRTGTSAPTHSPRRQTVSDPPGSLAMPQPQTQPFVPRPNSAFSAHGNAGAPGSPQSSRIQSSRSRLAPEPVVRHLSEPSLLDQRVAGKTDRDVAADSTVSLDRIRGRQSSAANARANDPATRRSASRIDPTYATAAVRHSRSEKFSLDYELEAVGSSGVDAVELWGTTDQGNTWKRWGVDPDNTSPFDIETAEDGVFGFRIVVLGRNGLASPRPLPGESPDILVAVDRSKPAAQITNVRYGVGDRVGSLVIQYECSDNRLAARPVALAFSDSAEGPWTTIAAGLENDGDYVWPADPQLPRQIFLRLDVTDKAGNIGSHVIDRPIDSRGLAPRARIRSFRSLEPDAVSIERAPAFSAERNARSEQTPSAKFQ